MKNLLFYFGFVSLITHELDELVLLNSTKGKLKTDSEGNALGNESPGE